MTDAERILRLTEMIIWIAANLHVWHLRQNPYLPKPWRDCDFGACKLLPCHLAEMQEVTSE